MGQDGEERWQRGVGDMPVEEFRRYGHQIVEWIAAYLENPERYAVMSRLAPGEIAQALPVAAPRYGEAMEAILRDFERIIMPGITHWNHPAFFAYFAVTASGPGILAEYLSAALNVNAMLWRTSPAATELETVTLDWLRQMLGLPGSFQGVIYDTASISTLVAIAAAREAVGAGIRERGMSGGPRLRLYCSEEAHSSVEKGAMTLGIGQGGVRKIGTDSEFRLRPELLQEALREDIDAGWHPFCVVATVGTTSTTSIDPVPAVAALCREHGLWLHVDGAYGGVPAILPEKRWVFDGVAEADSVVVNPHKWLFTPIDISTFYTRRLDTVQAAFSLVPEYLRTGDDNVRNYMDYGPQLGRRFRALKLWFVLRSFGVEGVEVRLREHLRLAAEFRAWVEEAPGWELMAPTPFSTVCFRATVEGWDDAHTDALNEAVMNQVNAGGEAYLSHTKLRGHFTLRVAIGNLHTQQAHVSRLWELLQKGRAAAVSA